MTDKSISVSNGPLVTCVGREHEEESADRPVSFRRRLRRWLWHRVSRGLMLSSVVALVIARWIGRRRQVIGSKGREIMLTGRFDSHNWILAHLGPLSASKECAHLWMVSTNPVPSLPKVSAIYPPKWLTRVIGVTQARLLTFLWAAMRKRPHVIGGFHLIPNGIAAALVGSWVGARSMYFCVGGPPEVRDGGVRSEQRPFTDMETADAVVENRLIRAVSMCDTVITMGTKAVDFFRDNGVDADFHIVSGGIDPRRFHPTKDIPPIDLILTGRLVSVKRIDVFLEAVRLVAERLPKVRATIVGDGPLRDELRLLSVDRCVVRNVEFVGHQTDVENWLRHAKIFVLTSDSEGLSLSMMEAMMCGLPAVVSDVGDLGDLVENGVNGYLVPRRSPELFADRLVELLSDKQKLESFSQAAHRSAMRYETCATIQRWDRILANL